MAWGDDLSTADMKREHMRHQRLASRAGYLQEQLDTARGRLAGAERRIERAKSVAQYWAVDHPTGGLNDGADD